MVLLQALLLESIGNAEIVVLTFGGTLLHDRLSQTVTEVSEGTSAFKEAFTVSRVNKQEI